MARGAEYDFRSVVVVDGKSFFSIFYGTVYCCIFKKKNS